MLLPATTVENQLPLNLLAPPRLLCAVRLNDTATSFVQLISLPSYRVLFQSNPVPLRKPQILLRQIFHIFLHLSCTAFERIHYLDTLNSR